MHVLQEMAENLHESHDPNDFKSPEWDDLSYPSKEIRKELNYDKLEEMLTITKDLFSKVDNTLETIPADRSAIDELTSEDEHLLIEMFERIDKATSRIVEDKEKIMELIEFIEKRIENFPRSNSGILAFFDLEERYNEIETKMHSNDFLCNQKEHELIKHLKQFALERKNFSRDITDIKSVVTVLEKEGDKMNEKEIRIEEAKGMENIDRLDLIKTFMPKFIEGRESMIENISNLEKHLLHMEDVRDEYKKLVDDYYHCAEGERL